MTNAEYKQARRLFVEQTARRVGIELPLSGEIPDWLDAIREQDSAAHDLLVKLRAAYKAWFEASTALAATAAQRADIERPRQEVIQRISDRDAARRALVAYLDAHFPSRRRGKDRDVVPVPEISR